MTRRALLIMAKEPRPGTTKTRLCPPLSAEEAAELYRCLLLDTVQAVRAAAAAADIPFSPFIAFHPREARELFQEMAPDFQLVRQRGEGLAGRLEGVLAAAQAMGYDEVLAVNSDSPSLPAAYLETAFRRLGEESVDVVFGPSDDGGYYLIGWKRPYPRLLREVTMSTSHVLADTLAIARQEQIKTFLSAGVV